MYLNIDVQLQASANYGSSYQPTYSGIYDDFPSIDPIPQPPHPPEMAAWNQMSLPPPPQQAVAPAPFLNNVEDQIKKEGMISLLFMNNSLLLQMYLSFSVQTVSYKGILHVY